MSDQSMVLKTNKTLRIFWISVDVLMAGLCLFELADKHASFGAKVFTILLLGGLAGFVTWSQLKIHMVLKNGILTFNDNTRRTFVRAPKVNLPLNDIQTVRVGMPSYLAQEFNQINPMPGTVMSSAIAGLLSPAAGGGVAARSVEPYFVFSTKTGAVYATTAKPYGKADFKKLIEIFQSTGMEVRLQDSIAKMLS